MFFGGYGFPATLFEQSYQCYPFSFIDKAHLEIGDKVILPDSALKCLALLQVDYPMFFEIYNATTERKSHCGVLEFTAEEGMLYMPYWMMQNMLLQEGDTVSVKMATLPKGTYVKLQPHTKDFLDISDPKAVLEKVLRNFSCLTVGDSIMVSHNEKYYYIDVIEAKPSSAISIIETDCEVDFAPPLDWKQPTKGSTTSSADLSTTIISQEAKDEAGPKFIPFTGVGRRVDGKTVQNSAGPVSASRSTKSTFQTTSGNSSGLRSMSSAAAKRTSDSNDAQEKASAMNLGRDEVPKEPSKFQPFTGKRYVLKG
ncbi:hypothetical protein SUGI_0901660 [Cryptomeria japonica]|uniref:uncharacterized protein LOC131063264 n=1 Tax=Cryptomeria japonica TaxID=3369 RepID=UPI002414BF7F|nr:uncharacterized protein LOC131063264 [Cryptomeria japonica]XP_057853034.2 uncharacterized protein LOC131063264 [Cryptomeria japonica]XP_057853035.2 uncharacterized protein LOC131063264 [Cryptomeria japonica]XP_057853036.2 uncharacterized protein LOC131063264 [Cryptomeria japonica]GLJ43392.1 hypothetical protein SUGI_0901660 [Cryptomeria japonica]